MRASSKTNARVVTYSAGVTSARTDVLATEEPLEIRLEAGGEKRTLALTMRTPGSDFELAAGFLFGEGVVSEPRAIANIAYCVDEDVGEEQRYNIVNVRLRLPQLPELPTLDRHFLTSSACGVCGRATLDALHDRGCPAVVSELVVAPEVVVSLPDSLRSGQGLFNTTGGLHAAGLFDAAGKLLAVREDVGRHNAVDKLVGWALMNGKLPLSQHILMVSGRTSYEIVQKAIVAGLPLVCSVSAPSSLAVQLAEEFGLTLVGFLRGERFNVYAGQQRIGAAALQSPTGLAGA
jgi:FdhD protein